MKKVLFKQEIGHTGEFTEVTQGHIIELVKTELDETCHMSNPEDFESKLDFYLENVEQDSYIDYVLGRYDNMFLKQESGIKIQNIVIEEITKYHTLNELINSRLEEVGSSGVYECKIQFTEIEDKDIFEEYVNMMGFECWTDINDGEYYTITDSK